MVVEAERLQRPDDVDSTTPRRRQLFLLAILAGLVAVICAVLLPLAPVRVNNPVVTWPLDPAAPQPTSLLLNTYAPNQLDVGFSCEVARRVDQSSDGVLLATIAAQEPTAPQQGLVVRVADGRVTATALGTQLLDQQLPAGACSYRIHGVPGALVTSRDGVTVGTAALGVLPDVDSLSTSLPATPGLTSADFSVRLQIDDSLSTGPAPIKVVLLVITGIAVLVSIWSLLRLDRRRLRPPAPGRIGRRWPYPADAVVAAVMIGWLFLAPMTDDDGYYSAIAQNVPHEGYVAQYYQLYNQSLSPFSWFYYLLSKWQVLGLTPVVLRIPALVAGLVTWLLLRRFVFSRYQDGFPAGVLAGRWGPALCRGVLAVVFLAWWLPYCMGVRPEAFVAVLSAGVLVSVATALARRRLAFVGLAICLAGLAATCHPTGFVALAPLVAAAPALWTLIRSQPRLLPTAARLLSVLAPGALASVAAFSDGTFYEFVRSKQLVLNTQDLNDWYDEFQRYDFLLSPIPMGSYAKRAAVLLGLAALLWFVIVLVAARARRIAVPPRLVFAGWSLALGFTALLITPSKWTHHFGALSGLGPAFLGLFLVGAVSISRRLTAGSRPALPVLAAGFGTLTVVAALSMHGPNNWAYSWMLGMPHSFAAPFVSVLALDSPLLWILALAVVTVVMAAWFARAAPGWRSSAGLVAMPVVAVGFLLVMLVYLLGSFSYATARTWDTWSPSAAAFQDPLGHDCVASGAIEVADDRSAVSLVERSSAPSASGGGAFVQGGGYFPLDRPGVALAADPPPVWGSLVPTSGNPSAEANIGEFSSPWFALDTPGAHQALVVMAAGRLSGDNSLVAEYGRATGASVDVITQINLDDTADAPAWRGLALPSGRDVPIGADSIRLIAHDGSTGNGGWLAFSAPSVQTMVPLQQLVGDAPTAVSWQFAFLFPCLHQPVVANGIRQPVDFGVAWGNVGINGFNDNTWQDRRGGLFGQVERSAGVTRMVARLVDFPQVAQLQVYRFDQPFADGGYTLRRTEQTVSGLTGPS